MKTYLIQAKQTLVEVWTYTVEANSEEEALQLVEEGEMEDNDDHYQKDLGDLTYSIEGSEPLPPCASHSFEEYGD